MAAYLKYGKPEPGQAPLARMVIDMLAMRRALVAEVIRMTAARIGKGGTVAARAAMARAWSLRDTPAYAREDFEVMRTIAEAARFTPGLWLLNRIAKLWADAAAVVRFAIRPPEDYVAVHTRFFDLLEAGDADAASKLMGDYLARHDHALEQALGGPA